MIGQSHGKQSMVRRYKKTNNPISEDDVRIISLTSHLSKVLEPFVIGWLLEYVSDQLDWGQYIYGVFQS